MALSGIEEIEQRFSRVRDLGQALLGVVVGWLCAVAALRIFRGFEPAVFAWLMVLGIAAVTIRFAVVNPRIRAAAIAALLGCAATFAFLARNPVAAIERAKAIAGSRPYCVQVATGISGYRRAVSQADLTSLTMRAPGGQFHGIMAVGESGDFDLYNWSYRNQDWMKLNTNGDFQTPAIGCRPRTDFLNSLPFIRLTWAGLGEVGPRR
jgi:hypothetical protein